ncbi:putative ThiF/HesA family dinucleotide-utilizing enzyme [Rhizobium anhuiense]|jgi:predicted ThiF/HesA family dinucleotide-utilizing enzyme
MSILRVTPMSRDRRSNMCLIGVVRLGLRHGRAKMLLFRGGVAMTLKTSGRKSQPHEFIFPVHTRTIAEIRYNSLSRVMTVVYHDGRSCTTSGIQGPAMLRILAQQPLERSPFLLQTVI